MPKHTDDTSLSALPDYDFLSGIRNLPFVEAIYLFGSRARGDDTVYSDIDIAILAPSAGYEEWDTICRILDNAPVLDKIDYIRYDTLEDGLYKQQIDKYRKCLYAKP